MVGKETIKPLGVNQAALNLKIKEGEIVALVGGGGKSTLLSALGDVHGKGTVLTTTTKMGSDQVGNATLLIRPSKEDLVSVLSGNLPVMIWDSVDGEKAFGVDPSLPESWLPEATRIIVEADGARRRPAKAPALYEPVLPSGVTTVIAVIGADAIDRVIEDQCHRPLRASLLLLNQNGSRKNLESGVRFVIAITKISSQNQNLVDELVKELRNSEPEIEISLVSSHNEG